jgi:enoyl-CoA hydratase
MPANDEVLSVSIEDRVAVLVVSRPSRLNALDHHVCEALVRTLEELDRDPAVQVVVMTGAGEKAFIAGADITEFEGRTPVEQVRALDLVPVYSAAEVFSKPFIVAINGLCLGGGCELAMAADIRIASDRARFGQPEINLGIIPGGGGTQRLPRLVGLGQAYKMLYTGGMIDAAEALRIGLVDEVVAPDQLLDRARSLATTIAAKSPVALRLIKEAVKASARMPLDQGLRLESALFGLAFSTEDKVEGVAAFLAKRQATFVGR